MVRDDIPRRRRLSREESQAETRLRLLEAAAEAFATKGLDRTSVEQIADLAGYSRGAFYSNFEDKHALVSELLEHRRHKLHRFSQMREGSETLSQFLDALAEREKAQDPELPEWFMLRAEIILYALRHGDVKDKIASRERASRSAIGEGIRKEAKLAGTDLNAETAEKLGVIIHALQDGLAIQRLLDPGAVESDELAQATRMLMELAGVIAPS